MFIETKNKISSYLAYMHKHYQVVIPVDEFIADADRLAESRDSLDGAVNYQNFYKKYLKIIANQAFQLNISLERALADMHVHLSTLGDIFDCYEVIMLSLFKSDDYKNCNKLRIDEILYAGLTSKSYVELIKPEDIPMTAYEEYRKIRTNAHESMELRQILQSLTNMYKSSKNKEALLKRCALLSMEAEDEYLKYSIFQKKRWQYKKLLKQTNDYITKLINRSKKDANAYRQELIHSPGNYTKNVEFYLQKISDDELVERNKKYYEIEKNYSFRISDFDTKVTKDITHHNMFQSFTNIDIIMEK